MSADARLKGQEVTVRAVAGGTVVEELQAIATFNDAVKLEQKQDGFLGEVVDRFDMVLNGYGGDMEVQVNQATWLNFVKLIEDKATRRTPDLEFNMIRSDFFPNNDSAVLTYKDVSFGEIPTNVPSRKDFVKARFTWGCSERPIEINNVL